MNVKQAFEGYNADIYRDNEFGICVIGDNKQFWEILDINSTIKDPETDEGSAFIYLNEIVERIYTEVRHGAKLSDVPPNRYSWLGRKFQYLMELMFRSNNCDVECSRLRGFIHVDFNQSYLWSIRMLVEFFAKLIELEAGIRLTEKQIDEFVPTVAGDMTSLMFVLGAGKY